MRSAEGGWTWAGGGARTPSAALVPHCFKCLHGAHTHSSAPTPPPHGAKRIPRAKFPSRSTQPSSSGLWLRQALASCRPGARETGRCRAHVEITQKLSGLAVKPEHRAARSFLGNFRSYGGPCYLSDGQRCPRERLMVGSAFG